MSNETPIRGYDFQTEIFTAQGWKFFSELEPEDRVAQVRGWETGDFTMRFGRPLQLHRRWYAGHMLQVEAGRVNYCVTPAMRLLFQRRAASGYKLWQDRTADEARGLQRRFAVMARLSQDGFGTYNEGAYQGLLLCAARRPNDLTLVVRLRRDRKRALLRQLLDSLKQPYIETEDGRGLATFQIRDHLSLAKGEFELQQARLEMYSDEYLRGLFDGLMAGSGAARGPGWDVTLMSLDMLQLLDYLATANGYSLGQRRTLHRSEVRQHSALRAMINTRPIALLKTAEAEERSIPYQGWVYGVTVASGMVLTRRNGRQLVCGSTPYQQEQLRLSEGNYEQRVG